MNQDMEANSILNMPSDIDELEKEKAIESIVLETSAADSCRDDFEESDLLLGADSTATVTNSLYDADESLKSTDAENGCESTETKDKDLDSTDGEHSTSIVAANEPCNEQELQSEPQQIPPSTTPPQQLQQEPQPQAISPPPQQQPQQQQQQQQQQLPSISNQVIVAKPVVSSTVSTSPNKYIYVKLIPKTSVQTVVATVPKSPPKSISLTTLKTKYDKPLEKVETKKLSPKTSVEEATTSNVSSSAPSKSIGHTVNLLNNNRILIKSVKNHSNNAQMPISTISKPSINEMSATSSSLQVKKNDDTKHQTDAKVDITFQATANVTPSQDINQSHAIEMKCTPKMNNGDCVNTELEIKKEQLQNENSMESNSDIRPTETTFDDKSLKIKREFEQLQKTVNASKVLCEYVIEHNKRNRRPTKSGKVKHKHNNTMDANSSVDDKMTVFLNRSVSPSSSSVRSASKDSDRSATSSFTSSAGKRNTRSMNTDFSAKQKKFLKGIQQVTRGTDDETDNNSFIDDDDDDLDYFAKQNTNITERRKSTVVKSFNSELKTGWDKYCWRCHQHDSNLFCSSCIKSYHANCLKMKVLSPSDMNKWQCPECIEIKAAEKENKKKKFDVKHFNKLLKYAMNRILQDPNLQQFQFPVNRTQNPGYGDVIVNPINLSKIENNIDNLMYTNSEAFLSDIKWILHNCSIYFSDNYKVTRAAKSLQKVSKQEVGDIETCPECYLNANTMTDNWFTETCAKPHLILWAKLKGFPYWPAKAMSINSTLVDVRFFGEHDRANIPSKDCYLYSREDPNPPTNKYKRNTIADCVKEVDIYIENIKAKYGAFNYAELKTPFNPQMADQHLFSMIPGLRTARGRRRSSAARSDLTLKIVKTADNNLSVVKKDQIAKELPQIKRTVDITGDEAVSRTPTPPQAVLSRRKTSDTRIKRSKSTNRHSDGKLTTLDSKSYQVLRRKSMAVEKLDQKRVNVIQANLDLNSSNESPEVSFIQYTPKSMNEKIETEVIPKKAGKTTTKKRKMSVDHVKSNEVIETPEKHMKLDSPKATTSLNDDRPEDEVEVNILRSVGLVKKTSAPDLAPIERQPPNNSTNVVQKKNSTCDTNETNVDATRTRTDAVQRVDGVDDSPVVLVPFLEVKKESENVSSAESRNSGEQTPSSSQTLICLPSSSENTPNKGCTEENLSNIKTETSSDDDSLVIVEDEITSSVSNASTSTKLTIDEQLERRGIITVRDLSKMTVKESQQQARKSFPKGPSSTSILKPRNNAANNKPAPMNNMVCIPLDGLPRLDVTYNSSQPPPLSVVGSGNSVSLLSNNQPLSTSSTSTSNYSNGPPPLSISAIPSMSTANQTSISNSILLANLSNGTITEGMASAVTDLLVRRQPPQLTARPTAPLRSDGDTVFPSEAGSVCKILMENAHKMTDFFRSVIEDTLGDLSNMASPEARIRLLEMELEKEKNLRQKEIVDNKANYERMLTEMKKNMDKDRARAINEVRKQCESERIRSVEETKRKQWCANCLKEAQFYCCWNTSYCNHTCQRKHWEQHMNNCAQLESSPNVQNSRKGNLKTHSKAEVRSQVQLQTKPQPQPSNQKDNINVSGTRSTARVSNNSMVPALRNILPKNSVVSLNPTATQPRHLNQSTQSQTKPASNSQCIILGRPISNWSGQASKATSLLHSNTIFLPSSSQPYATITNVAPSSTGVSLLNSSQSQKSLPNETIIIP